MHEFFGDEWAKPGDCCYSLLRIQAACENVLGGMNEVFLNLFFSFAGQAIPMKRMSVVNTYAEVPNNVGLVLLARPFLEPLASTATQTNTSMPFGNPAVPLLCTCMSSRTAAYAFHNLLCLIYFVAESCSYLERREFFFCLVTLCYS